MTTMTATNEAIAAAVEPVTRDITNAAAAQVLRPSWYAIAKKGENEAEIRVYEDIGAFGVTAKTFADDLEKVGAQKIHVRLNTYGGDAFDGIAIHNALKAHTAEIVIHIDGIAASAGSIIAMAGDEIRMANNAFMMVHEARGGVLGEADDMRSYADMLDKLNDSIAGTYQAQAGRTRSYWREKMAEESWFSAEEAKDEGLTDIIEEPNKTAKNRFDFKVMNHVPEAARKQWGKRDDDTNPGAAPAAAPETETPPETQQQQAAPDVPVPANPSEQENVMAENNPATPAPTPAPVATALADNQTIQQLLAQARADERQKAEQELMDRFNAICAASPDDFEMVVNAFKTGQTANAIKLAYETKQREQARARETVEAKDREIHRLTLLANYGGHQGVQTTFTAEGQEQYSVEPKAQAEAEWSRNHENCRARFSSKENYVIVRTKELEGRFHMSIADAS